MPGGRSKYFFFNKKRRERDKIHSSQVIPGDEKRQKNILEFFGGGKRKEPNDYDQTESGECKRSKKADCQKDEAEKRIDERLDEFRARDGSADKDFYYHPQSFHIPPVSSSVRNGNNADTEQVATSSNPTPLEKQACKQKWSFDFVSKTIFILGHRVEGKVSETYPLRRVWLQVQVLREGCRDRRKCTRNYVSSRSDVHDCKRPNI